MTLRLALASLASAALVAALIADIGAQAPRSVWVGVYTAEQAKRGERLAADQCVVCHGARLAGAEAAPPLTGPVFAGNWEGVLLSDLFERMRMTMPLDRPGSLTRQQNADLLAYMLSLAEIPAGDTPLPPELAALEQIRFDTYNPGP